MFSFIFTVIALYLIDVFMDVKFRGKKKEDAMKSASNIIQSIAIPVCLMIFNWGIIPTVIIAVTISFAYDAMAETF